MTSKAGGLREEPQRHAYSAARRPRRNSTANADPLLARLFRDNARRCRRLAGSEHFRSEAPILLALASDYDRKAAILERRLRGAVTLPRAALRRRQPRRPHHRERV